jgi:hypothetical protein
MQESPAPVMPSSERRTRASSPPIVPNMGPPREEVHAIAAVTANMKCLFSDVFSSQDMPPPDFAARQLGQLADGYCETVDQREAMRSADMRNRAEKLANRRARNKERG